MDIATVISRAHLSWDAKTLWVMRGMAQAQILRISMDGVTSTDYRNVVKSAHHDFAVAARRRDRADHRRHGQPDRAFHRRDEAGRDDHHRRRRPVDGLPATGLLPELDSLLRRRRQLHARRSRLEHQPVREVQAERHAGLAARRLEPAGQVVRARGPGPVEGQPRPSPHAGWPLPVLQQRRHDRLPRHAAGRGADARRDGRHRHEDLGIPVQRQRDRARATWNACRTATRWSRTPSAGGSGGRPFRRGRAVVHERERVIRLHRLSTSLYGPPPR